MRTRCRWLVWMDEERRKRKPRSVDEGVSYTRRKCRREVRVDAKCEVPGSAGAVDLGNGFARFTSVLLSCRFRGLLGQSIARISILGRKISSRCVT